MQTFTEAQSAIEAAEAQAVLTEKTMVICWHDEGYCVMPEFRRRSRTVIERIHPQGDTWDYLAVSADWAS